MALLVMKFGGTSVANVDRIKRAAKRVALEVAHGKNVLVIVSAMSGKTNPNFMMHGSMMLLFPLVKTLRQDLWHLHFKRWIFRQEAGKAGRSLFILVPLIHQRGLRVFRPKQLTKNLNKE